MHIKGKTNKLVIQYAMDYFKEKGIHTSLSYNQEEDIYILSLEPSPIVMTFNCLTLAIVDQADISKDSRISYSYSHVTNKTFDDEGNSLFDINEVLYNEVLDQAFSLYQSSK